MRREVLYQYDLPIDVIDAIPTDEEVVSVLFGRSKEKRLIPILFSKKRILWGYPETDTVYKVFEQHYIDIDSVSAKFPPALSPTITIHTPARKIVYPNIQNSVEDVRGALLTIAEELKIRTGIHWEILQQKNLLTDEYTLQKNPSIPVGVCLDDEIFEDKIRETTPHETLFTHFAADGEEDVFEDQEKHESAPTSAMVDRITRMVQATEPTEESGEVPEQKNDAVIYDTASIAKNEQWHNEGGGDAEILPRGKPWKNMPAPAISPIPVPHETYTPEDDDSEVYVSETPRPKLIVPKPKAAAVSEAMEEPASNVSVQEQTAEAKTLQPKAGIDEETIDKSLEALKFLRDNNIISEAEYKKRSLSLFEKEE